VHADETNLYIALDWADGGDLKALLKRHSDANLYMSEARVLEFFIQIARAVRHMHEKRILHRDLKPANCLLLKNGTVKIADLGLGRHLEQDVNEVHSRVGTPLYMAPEILQGKVGLPLYLANSSLSDSNNNDNRHTTSVVTCGAWAAFYTNCVLLRLLSRASCKRRMTWCTS